MNIELINHLLAVSTDIPAPLKREVSAVIHKINYPMTNILAQVPGASLTDRAKKLKVSRQTMYVWASERFRPTKVQAKRISKITGVPIEQIMGEGNDAGRKARKKTARVATRRKKVASSNKRISSGRRRKVDDGSRAKSA